MPPQTLPLRPASSRGSHYGGSNDSQGRRRESPKEENKANKRGEDALFEKQTASAKIHHKRTRSRSRSPAKSSTSGGVRTSEPLLYSDEFTNLESGQIEKLLQEEIQKTQKEIDSNRNSSKVPWLEAQLCEYKRKIILLPEMKKTRDDEDLVTYQLEIYTLENISEVTGNIYIYNKKMRALDRSKDATKLNKYRERISGWEEKLKQHKETLRQARLVYDE
jgi:glycerophosphoryl diester phosphodiesterase